MHRRRPALVSLGRKFDLQKAQFLKGRITPSGIQSDRIKRQAKEKQIKE